MSTLQITVCIYLAGVGAAAIALLFCATWGRFERRTQERMTLKQVLS